MFIYILHILTNILVKYWSPGVIKNQLRNTYAVIKDIMLTVIWKIYQYNYWTMTRIIRRVSILNYLAFIYFGFKECCVRTQNVLLLEECRNIQEWPTLFWQCFSISPDRRSLVL